MTPIEARVDTHEAVCEPVVEAVVESAPVTEAVVEPEVAVETSEVQTQSEPGSV